MEVLYLNVNGFAGAKDKRTKGDTNNIEIAKKILYEIFNKSDPEIIFLSEFNVHEDAVKKLIKTLENKGYLPVYPNNIDNTDGIKDGRIKSIVMAFVKTNDKELRSEKSPKCVLTYKWNEIVYKGRRLVGLHPPSIAEKYRTEEEIGEIWKAVYDHYINLEDEKINLIGDMNVFHEGTPGKEWFDKIIESGGIDAWDEKYPDSTIEESYTHITRKGEKVRLDYAIMSKSAYNDLIDIKNLQGFIKEGLSDHSAILINLKDIE